MTSTSIRIAAALLAGLLSLASGASAQSAGFAASLDGQVTIQPAGQTGWLSLSLDQDVSIGDVIRTGADSSVKLLLNDDTILSIGADTELEIDSFVIGQGIRNERSILKLVRGRIRAWIGELFGGPSRVEVHTPTAVIGVKGTAYEAWVVERLGEIETVVCVTHGAVYVRGVAAPEGASIELGMGVCARIRADGRVERIAAPPEEAQQAPLAAEPTADSLLLGALQRPIRIEDLITTQPPVGLAPGDAPPGRGGSGDPDATGRALVALALQPKQANAEPILDGEDPLWAHDWFESPLQALSVRSTPPIVFDKDGIGSNLQIFRIVPFYNFDTKRDDVRVFVR